MFNHAYHLFSVDLGVSGGKDFCLRPVFRLRQIFQQLMRKLYSLNLELNKGNRIESTDFLRGIAACFVMLFHFTLAGLPDTNPLKLLGGHGFLGVEVFFIVSGFIIPYSMYVAGYNKNMVGSFLTKRIIRIHIPYLAIAVVEIILIYVTSLTPWKDDGMERLDGYGIWLHGFYLNDIMGEPWLVPIFWSLAIEIQYYLLIALLFPLLSSAKIQIRVLTIAVMALSTFVLQQPTPLFFNYSLLFLMGIVAFQFMVGIIKPGEFWITLAALFVLMYLKHSWMTVGVTAATLAVILFARIRWKWSDFLGMISYSLYLVHLPFGGRLLLLTLKVGIRTEWLVSVLIVVYLIATIFVAWIFYLLVEKPAMGLAKRAAARLAPVRPKEGAQRA